MIKLKDFQHSLLLSVLSRRAPQYIPEFARSPESTLSRDTVLEVLDELGLEFMASGLRPDSEPNERGLLLEELIGIFSLEAQRLEETP